jgi:hypothetical protein
MTICVAFDTFQLSCHEVPPRWLAVKLITGLLAVVCGGGSSTETITIADDVITVPAELVALIVYTVDVAGDTSLVPAALTIPIPWSILTVSAPVTFHNRVDVSPELIVDGLLLNATITGGVITCGVGFVVWTGNVKQPGMTNSNNSSDSEIKTNFFNVCTS